jgi:hypothetical protein
MSFSITTHCRIDVGRPGLDTTGQVLHAAKTPVLKEHCHLKAARAVMANDNDVLIRIQFVTTYRHEMHGNVLGAFKVAKLEFPRFAHIKQDG